MARTWWDDLKQVDCSNLKDGTGTGARSAPFVMLLTTKITPSAQC